MIGSDWRYVDPKDPYYNHKKDKVEKVNNESKSSKYHGILSDDLKYNEGKLIGSDWKYVDPKDPYYNHKPTNNTV